MESLILIVVLLCTPQHHKAYPNQWTPTTFVNRWVFPAHPRLRVYGPVYHRILPAAY